MTKSWEPDWEGLINQIMITGPEPVAYPLKVLTQQDSNDEEEDVPTDPPCVLLLCQVIKIQRYDDNNYIMVKPNFKGINRDIYVIMIYALGHYIYL